MTDAPTLSRAREAALLSACSWRVQQVYRAFCSAAENDAVAPGNNELGARAKCEPNSAGTAVGTLAAIGLIDKQQFGHGRRVFVRALGKWTAHPGGKAVARRQAPVAKRDPAPAAAPEELPPAVDRRPCPRCGTRGDIGCAHGRAGVDW